MKQFVAEPSESANTMPSSSVVDAAASSAGNNESSVIVPFTPSVAESSRNVRPSVAAKNNEDVEEDLSNLSLHQVQNDVMPRVKEEVHYESSSEDEDLVTEDGDDYISVGSDNYFNYFTVEMANMGEEEAYTRLLNHSSYKPHLDDITNEPPPPDTPFYHSAGFASISRLDINTFVRLCPGRLKQSTIPGTTDTILTHTSNIGEFIRTIYFLDKPTEKCSDVHLFALVHYKLNNDKIIVIAKPFSDLDKGSLSIEEGFHLLVKEGNDNDKEPVLDFNRHLNFCISISSEALDNCGLDATNDDYCWISKSKSAPIKWNPKWDYRFLLDSDVNNGVYRPYKERPPNVDESELVLIRRQRASHPSYPLSKNTYFLSKVDDKRHILSKRVIRQYIITGKTSEGKLDTERKRTGERKMRILREGMLYRTTAQSKDYLLKEKNITATARQIWNASRRDKVPSFIRRRVGDKCQMDLVELVKCTVMNPGAYTIVDHVDKLTGMQIQMIPDAFRCFLASLPDKDVLNQHRRKVAQLDKLRSREERLKFFNDEFAPMQNANGFMKGVSGVLMVDTTFNVAPCTTRSNKTRFVPIAIIYHPKKDGISHNIVASVVDKMFEEFPQYKDKRVPCFITDSEDALLVYAKTKLCDMAVHLKCCVHLRDNITKRKRKVDTRCVFGTVYESEMTTDIAPDGDPDASYTVNPGPRKKRILKHYLLGALTIEEYNKIKDSIDREPTVPEQVKTFIRRKQLSLFEFYSLRRKLEAGYIAQFTTTNGLESFNNTIKILFDGKKPPEKSLPKFVEFVEGMLSDLSQAVMGKCQHIQYVGPEKWNLMSNADQDELLATLGLKYPYENKWEGIPRNFVNAVSADRLRRIQEIFHEYVVVNVRDGLHSLIYGQETDEPISFLLSSRRTSTEIMTKCHNNCSKKTICCDHQLLYFMSLKAKDQELFAIAHANPDRHKRVLLANTARGTGSKRKGRIFSKGNHGRAIDVFEDGSLLMDEPELYNMNEIMSEDEESTSEDPEDEDNLSSDGNPETTENLETEPFIDMLVEENDDDVFDDNFYGDGDCFYPPGPEKKIRQKSTTAKLARAIPKVNSSPIRKQTRSKKVQFELNLPSVGSMTQVQKKRGRPRKATSSVAPRNEVSAETSVSNVIVSANSSAISQEPTRRCRGRPPKGSSSVAPYNEVSAEPSVSNVIVSANSSAISQQPTRRCRGRPPKATSSVAPRNEGSAEVSVPNVIVSASSSAKPQEPCRGGRSPKITSSTVPNPITVKRTTPNKVEIIKTTSVVYGTRTRRSRDDDSIGERVASKRRSIE